MTLGAIRLDPHDHVATALRALGAGETVEVGGGAGAVRVTEPIPAFHKLALCDLAAGAPVRKYGAVIGALSQDVQAGALVHVHNLESLRARDG